MNTTIILLIIYHTIVIYAILNVKKMNRFYHIFEQKRRKGRKSHSVSKENKIKILHVSAGFLVGAGGFGPPKSLTTDLQSAPFGHSGTLPYSVLQGKWSWWTDSNPRPADYKSAALPAELHQRISRVFTRPDRQRSLFYHRGCGLSRAFFNFFGYRRKHGKGKIINRLFILFSSEVI